LVGSRGSSVDPASTETSPEFHIVPDLVRQDDPRDSSEVAEFSLDLCPHLWTDLWKTTGGAP
jgi:hypothetical protein